MTNLLTFYFDMYFTEIIIGTLVLSILVVLISIFYVLFSSPGSLPIKKTQKNKKNKIKKIKYSKEFLKGVDGIDLDLKIDTKKTSIK